MEETDISFNGPTINNCIDQLTLECFTNKQNYNKIVNKQNIYTHERNSDMIKEYEKEIKNIISEYFRNPNNSINSELDNLFFNFSNACIEHEKSKIHKNNYGADDDEDMLFGNMDESREPTYSNPTYSNPTYSNPNDYLTSYWGKSVKKV
tara:strand:- start:40 stop:489 length:450 start_codon:yes stop_codon:yes gene_type:complete